MNSPDDPPQDTSREPLTQRLRLPSWLLGLAGVLGLGVAGTSLGVWWWLPEQAEIRAFVSIMVAPSFLYLVVWALRRLWN